MFDGIPIGLLYLNFIGMVLLFLTVVMGIKFIVRGARGYGGRGGPWGCGRGEYAGWRGQGPSHLHGWEGGHAGKYGGADEQGRHGPYAGRHGGRRHGGGRGNRAGAHQGARDQALDHVDLRLARGEMSTEQYLELRSALTQSRSSAGDHGDSSDGAHGGQRPQRRGGKALGIARLRLASGEIGVDEFNALRTALDA